MAKSKSSGVKTVEAVAEAEVVEVETTPEEPSTTTGKVEEKRYIYVGPSVMRTELIAGRVFICDDTTIEERLSGTFEKYPEARKLVVPIEQAAVSNAMIRKGGNSLTFAYNRLLKAEFI